MIDFAKITTIAGKGGDGAGSFTHIKGKRRGKADGGDGGRGGHVYMTATNDLNTLEPFRFKKEYRARDGGRGAPQRRKGAEGEDLVIKVPVGTMIRINQNTQKVRMSESQNIQRIRGSDRSEVQIKHSGSTGFPIHRSSEFSEFSGIYDLVEPGQKVLVARAGEGGRGNSHLRDDFGRRPFKGERGEEGEEVNLELELKLIADVGLIGLPNAGKSTLLSKLTLATPKIAAYPFTTLEPNLGVLEFAGPVSRFPPASARSDLKSIVDQEDNFELRAVESPPTTATRKRIIIADIPGLIEGASEGRGLGDLFLRHIERTKVLVHLIDISQDGDLWEIYQKVRNELKKYSKELVKKKEIIVLNKIDLIGEDEFKSKLDSLRAHRKRVIAISASSGKNIDKLVSYLQVWPK